MFNFNGITHITANPREHAPGYNYSFTGSVPGACLEPRTPTRADIMGGRVQPDGFAYHGRKLWSIEEALQVAKDGGARLCEAVDCACRRLF